MAVTVKPKNILEAFEAIVDLSEDSKLDDVFMTRAALPIKYAVRKLKLTPMQVVLLVLFVDRSEDRCIRISEIAGHTGCRTTKILRLSKDIDVLERLRYVRASRSSKYLSYRVPSEVIASLKANKPCKFEVVKVADTMDFFDYFKKLAEEKDDDEEIPSWCKHGLRNRSLALFELKLIENTNEDGMARSDAFKLADHAKETVLAELNLNNAGHSYKGLVRYDSLAVKRLIYNAEEQKQITELSSILSNERFIGVQECLRKAGMRPGFCCMF